MTGTGESTVGSVGAGASPSPSGRRASSRRRITKRTSNGGTQRNIEPLTRTEYEALRRAVTVWEWRQGPVPAEVREKFLTLIDTLWNVGCHPSVLCPRVGVLPSGKSRGDRRPEIRGALLVWRRPKTGRQLAAKLDPELAKRVQAYLEGGRVPYQTFLDWLHEVGNLAGVHAYPLRFRHRVAMQVWRKKGAGVARDALGVSTRVLADYTTLGDVDALEAVWEATRDD